MTALMIADMAHSFSKTATIRKVYPSYIGFRIKAALKSLADNGDPKLDGPIVSAVGDMETIGDCRYAIPVTDHNGTKYRITVEVQS